jgi:hypothetical protein
MIIQEPKYLFSEQTFVTSLQTDIRKKAFEFEQNLKGQYKSPFILPIPDDFIDPEVPRFILESNHGYSRIIASQTKIQLQITYDKNYWRDYDKVFSYFKGHSKTLSEVLDKNCGEDILFAGISLKLLYEMEEIDVVKNLSEKFLKTTPEKNYHDINFRFALPYKEKYYLNVHISNNREYSKDENKLVEPGREHAPNLSSLKLISQGLLCVLDFNNRLEYNNKEKYKFSFATIDSLFQILEDFTKNRLVKILNSGSVDYDNN